MEKNKVNSPVTIETVEKKMIKVSLDDLKLIVEGAESIDNEILHEKLERLFVIAKGDDYTIDKTIKCIRTLLSRIEIATMIKNAE